MTEQTEAAKAAHGHAVIVTPDGDDWRVSVAGTFKQQGQAILVAAAIGALLDLEAETRGEDGRIREKESHGNDPKDVVG